LGIVPHAGSAGFVHCPAAGWRAGESADILGPGCFHEFSGGVSHVFYHGIFIRASRHVNAQHRNSETIFHARINLHKIFPAWQNFTESQHVHSRAWFFQSFLEAIAKSRGRPVEIKIGTAFISIAAQKSFGLGSIPQISKPGHINSHRTTRSAHRWLSAESWHLPTAAAVAHMRGEIVSESTA